MTAPPAHVGSGEVFAAILRRAALRRSGATALDGNKLALVVEGGGLRGVCTAGGVVALEHLGFTELFDDVYGTSAGAMNAAYFLAGQAGRGIRIYYEEMIRREIVNPLRPWKVLDVERLFARAVMGHDGLRLEAVLASPSRLHVAVIDTRAGVSFLIDSRDLTSADLLVALRAATAIPVLYNRRVEVNGRLCMDAGILNPFPLADAIAAGCSHILVLLSHPASFRRPAAGPGSRWLFDRLSARGNARLSRAYAENHLLDAGLRDLALGRTDPPPGVNIAALTTDEGETVQRLTRDPAKLRAAALAFGRKTLRSFGADEASWALDLA